MNKQVYNRVFFSKDINKKRKITHEGVLLARDNKLLLYDETAKLIAEYALRNLKDTPNQNQFILGQYYIYRQEEVKQSDFKSGKCFMPVVLPSVKLPVKAAAAKEKDPDAFQLAHNCVLQSFLAKIMREHQLQGVKFLFQCVSGLRGGEITGAILADSMGLGKTLQAIGLVYTCLKTSLKDPRKGMINKAVIVCPLSLVRNWQNQLQKWLGNQRLSAVIVQNSKKQTMERLKPFIKQKNRLLLISYEAFLANVEEIGDVAQLIVLDEGHRLKNSNTKAYRSLVKIKCLRKILLTGTPIQNNLEQLFSCLKLVNPLLFPNAQLFSNLFIRPIEKGLLKEACKEDKQLSQERSTELTKLLKQFSLRRRPQVLQKYLPARHQIILYVNLSDSQKIFYKQLIRRGKQEPAKILSYLIQMRKLMLHPNLLLKHLSTHGESPIQNDSSCLDSYKMQVLKLILSEVRRRNDKMVIASSYAQYLDYVQPFVGLFERLDGSMSSGERQLALQRFQNGSATVLLLSSKAGGTGLNIVQANVMVLLQVDWNPSVDKQVMGRIWRQGQRKECFIYRLVSSRTFEQKVLQRQKYKQSLELNILDQSAFSAHSQSLFQLFQSVERDEKTWLPGTLDSNGYLTSCPQFLDCFSLVGKQPDQDSGIIVGRAQSGKCELQQDQQQEVLIQPDSQMMDDLILRKLMD